MSVIRVCVWRIILILACTTLGVAGLWPHAAHAEVSAEYQVKAAFLYHFAQFVEWPDESFERTDSRIRVCVYGNDPFGSVLEKTFDTKTVKGHRFSVVRDVPLRDVNRCHMLFVGSRSRQAMGQLRRRLNAGETLTIGESRAFLEDGGMVQFFLEDNKVRFAVNPDAIAEKHLVMSAKLLRLARIVKSKK